MNYIVALLLLFLSEEETFWVMVVIIEHTLKDYYSQVGWAQRAIRRFNCAMQH